MRKVIKILGIFALVLLAGYGLLAVLDISGGKQRSKDSDSFSFTLNEKGEIDPSTFQALSSGAANGGINYLGNPNALSEVQQKLLDSGVASEDGSSKESTNFIESIRQQLFPSSKTESESMLGVGGGKDEKVSIEDMLLAAYVATQTGNVQRVDDAIASLNARVDALNSQSTTGRLQEILSASVETTNTIIGYLEEIKKAPVGTPFDDIIAPESVAVLEAKTADHILSMFELLREEADNL